MSARDFFHNTVKDALTKDGWNITHDPYWIRFSDSRLNMYIDLAAERIIAAEKENKKIAIEIKSFQGDSLLTNFHAALGQFLDYRVALKEIESERKLFLAVSLDVYDNFFCRPFIQKVCQEYNVTLVIFNAQSKEIVSWIK